MVDTSRSISGPVKLQDNSRERVAFDLMKQILDLTPDRQDKVLETFARCLATIDSPTYGLEAIKKAVK